MIFSKKQWVSFFLSAAVILIGKFFTPIPSLTDIGNTSIFFMLGIIILLITQSVSPGLIAIIGITFMPILGLVNSLANASALFGNPLYFFLLACFVISAVVGKLPIAKRILVFFLKYFGKSTKNIITAILLTSMILSTFISNFAALLLIFIVAKEFTDMIDDEKSRKQTSKSLMIGLIFAVSIGGVAAPISNPCSALAYSYLLNAGYQITFLQWMAIGIPVIIVTFPIAMFLLFKIFKPVEQDEQTIKEFIAKVQSQIPQKVSVQEIIAFLILAVTFVLWVLNYNLMLVSCLCAVALLFPGFKLITWEEFNKTAGWDTMLMVCSLLAVASTMQSSGVINWLLAGFQSVVPVGANPLIVMLLLGVFTSLLDLVLPNGPVLISILGPSMIALGINIHVNPILLLIGFGIFTTHLFAIPIDAISLITYQSGKGFDAMDQPKVGIPLIIVMIVVESILISSIGKLFGFI